MATPCNIFVYPPILFLPAFRLGYNNISAAQGSGQQMCAVVVQTLRLAKPPGQWPCHDACSPVTWCQETAAAAQAGLRLPRMALLILWWKNWDDFQTKEKALTQRTVVSYALCRMFHVCSHTYKKIHPYFCCYIKIQMKIECENLCFSVTWGTHRILKLNCTFFYIQVSATLALLEN